MIYKIGQIVQVMDKKENVYIEPKATIYDVSEAGDGIQCIEATGRHDEDRQIWYNSEDYSIIILESQI